MHSRQLPQLILAVLSFVTPAIAAENGPAEDVPELKVLNNYAGKWDAAITLKDSQFESGEIIADWILDGRFLRQTIAIKVANSDKPLRMSTMMSYDPDQQRYRFWRFVSNGNVSESSGTWDAKTKTMTSVGTDHDLTATTTASFAKDGVEDWKIVVKDASGNEVATITGTNTRKKE